MKKVRNKQWRDRHARTRHRHELRRKEKNRYIYIYEPAEEYELDKQQFEDGLFPILKYVQKYSGDETIETEEEAIKFVKNNRELVKQLKGTDDEFNEYADSGAAEDGGDQYDFEKDGRYSGEKEDDDANISANIKNRLIGQRERDAKARNKGRQKQNFKA